MICDHDYLRHYTLKPNDVVLDLGASLGEFEDDNAEILKKNNCFIVCVEPTPWCFETLVSFLNKNFKEKNLMFLSVGVDNKIGNSIFNVSSCHLLNCFPKSENTINLFDVNIRKIKIPVVTLDLILNCIDKEIDFCKCDIEGLELESFLFCKNIRKIKNLAIASYHIRDNQETWIKLKPFFESQGFDVVHEKKKFLDFEAQSRLYCKRRD